MEYAQDITEGTVRYQMSIKLDQDSNIAYDLLIGIGVFTVITVAIAIAL